MATNKPRKPRKKETKPRKVSHNQHAFNEPNEEVAFQIERYDPIDFSSVNNKQKHEYKVKEAKRRIGRPTKIQTPEQLQEVANNYFFECEHRGLIPTLGKLQNLYGITRESYGIYRKDPRFSNTLKMIDDYILSCKQDALMNQPNKIVGLIFDLKANYGYSEKPEEERELDREKLKQQKIITQGLQRKLDAETEWKESRTRYNDVKRDSENVKLEKGNKTDNVTYDFNDWEDLIE